MNRHFFIEKVQQPSREWDFIIIGGGATGLGIAVDASSRGYKTLLLEQGDFAQGTSSRSTKLVHGGVRYLKQGNISLVLEALRERGLLRKNAPHLVSNLAFVVPNYDWWEIPFYGIGLKLYDLLAGDLGIGPSKKLNRTETIKMIPTIEPDDLRGGIIYYDAQFDDSRLAVTLAMTAAAQDAVLLNYARVEKLVRKNQVIKGIQFTDLLNGKEYTLSGKAVINATGVYCDSIRRLDDHTVRDIIAPSQGVHLVLDRSFLPGDTAIIVPHTDDGRVLFAVPWHQRVIVGTTDTPVSTVTMEPFPLAEEIDFLLTHAARYLTKDPQPSDVLSVFAGLRPLVRSSKDNDTAALSRDHSLIISKSGLITITGGKWTTYRKMAEDTVNEAALFAGLPKQKCITENLSLHGSTEAVDKSGYEHVYGSDWNHIQDLIRKSPGLKTKLHPKLPYTHAEVIWAVRKEMAFTIEDILIRRTRALILDARAAMECAADVAKLMAKELKKDAKWQKMQIANFTELAKRYIVSS